MHTESSGLSIGVVIVSYRRPLELIRCLQGIENQTLMPDDVMVVLRTTDHASRDAIEALIPGSLPLRIVDVTAPGVVNARRAGNEACRTDILCSLDDDAVPHPDWLERIKAYFDDAPDLGGVGGLDRCYDGRSFDDGKADIVGKLQWFGRVIGNHHHGYGKVREVDVVKGVNMSFRAKAFIGAEYDRRLRGSGAQPAEDIAFSLAVKRLGWRIIYDPQIVVDHYSGAREEERFYAQVSGVKDAEGFKAFAFNEAIAVWESLTIPGRAAFIAWSLVIGTGVCPGLAQAIRYTPRLGVVSWHRFYLAQCGKWAAFRDLTFRPNKNR